MRRDSTTCPSVTHPASQVSQSLAPLLRGIGLGGSDQGGRSRGPHRKGVQRARGSITTAALQVAGGRAFGAPGDGSVQTWLESSTRSTWKSHSRLPPATAPSTGIPRLAQKDPVCQELITPRPLRSPPCLPGPVSPEGGQHQRQEMKKNLRSN